MDVLIDIARLLLVGLVTGIFSSFLANRSFRYKKWWELRVLAYQDLIESLSDLIHFYDRNFRAESEYRDLSEEYRRKLADFWDGAYPRVRKSADSGAFLFSSEVNNALADFMKEQRDSNGVYIEDLNNCLAAARRCLSVVVASSKKDLKLKSPWL